MADHFGDRLTSAIANKSAAACVGLDPLIDRLPDELTRRFEISESAPPEAICDALFEFGSGIIEVIAPLVPAIKINIAFFERYHAEGVRTYLRLVHRATQAGLIVIGDVKRADIGHSSTQYARAQLADITATGQSDQSTPDAVTVNPYFGSDSIDAFSDIAREQGKGLFVLVQTSNASADQVQGIETADGLTLCQSVARIVEGWANAEGLVGQSGYSAMGAVVSPRDLPSTEKIRNLMPSCIFLVPGFGAQGRTAQEVAQCFKPDGTGALVTSSRGVIYAHSNDQIRAAAGDDWKKCVEHGCRDLVEAIRSITPGT